MNEIKIYKINTVNNKTYYFKTCDEAAKFAYEEPDGDKIKIHVLTLDEMLREINKF